MYLVALLVGVCVLSVHPATTYAIEPFMLMQVAYDVSWNCPFTDCPGCRPPRSPFSDLPQTDILHGPLWQPHARSSAVGTQLLQRKRHQLRRVVLARLRHLVLVGGPAQNETHARNGWNACVVCVFWQKGHLRLDQHPDEDFQCPFDPRLGQDFNAADYAGGDAGARG